MQQKTLGRCKRDSKTLILTQTQTLTVANATRLTSDRRSLEINCGMTKIANGQMGGAGSIVHDIITLDCITTEYCADGEQAHLEVIP